MENRTDIHGGNNQVLPNATHAEQHFHYHQKEAFVVNAILEIWESIVDVENFLAMEINERINASFRQDCNSSAVIDAPILKKTLDLIRKREILLPSAVSEAATKIIYYHYDVYNGYIATIKRGCRREITLEEVNRYVPERLNSDIYKRQKQILKESYRQI